MKKADLKALITTAMLIATEIVLSRFLSISLPTVKIGFGFLPIAIIAMLYGPIYAGIAAAAADFIGAVLFPIGAYFPGFTFTAFLTGAVYGLFLYRRPKGIVNIVIAVIIILFGLDLGLNTFWLQIITGKAYLALMPTRIFKTVVMLPVQIVLIGFFAKRFVYPLEQQ